MTLFESFFCESMGNTACLIKLISIAFVLGRLVPLGKNHLTKKCVLYLEVITACYMHSDRLYIPVLCLTHLWVPNRNLNGDGIILLIYIL